MVSSTNLTTVQDKRKLKETRAIPAPGSQELRFKTAPSSSEDAQKSLPVLPHSPRFPGIRARTESRNCPSRHSVRYWVSALPALRSSLSLEPLDNCPDHARRG